MAKRRPIIVVSNRGPVTYNYGPDRELEAARGGGGLVTALASLAGHHDVTWIASAMSDADREAASRSDADCIEEHARTGATYRLRFVSHEPEAYDLFYNVVANPTLWFLQHYLWDFVSQPVDENGRLQRAWDDGYAPVNRGFAEAVIEELARRPDALVFFNDYHLYLAPRFVRDRVPDAALAQFVHIPWAQSDYWHLLPTEIRVAIHDGLLANDLVGFHTPRWQRNFLQSAHRVLEGRCKRDERSITYAGRVTRVGAWPISVDVAEFEELCEHPRVLEHERAIVETRPEYLVVRADRTDPSKNIVRGFKAFELFLELHPELHERVTMLALLDPSRQNIPEYAEYLGAIEREARSVNEHFRRPGWTPIDLQIHDDFHQSVAAYKQYDVLFVNAVFDGLNLIAKEAPLLNERAGALVLSENAGAFEELAPYSVAINPFDVHAQAEAIYAALTMPEDERRRRLEAIRSLVREHDLSWWIGAQLAELDSWLSRDGRGATTPRTGARSSKPA